MTYDLVIKNGTVVDGTGRRALPGRCRDRGRQDRRDRQGDRGRQAHHRRRRPGRRAGLHRPAHALRRADLLGRRDHALVLARRDHVVMGNCGVGIAPCKPETREIAMRDLVNVEASRSRCSNTGITWDWETFPEFMDAAGGAQAVAQPRLPRAADAVPPLRDGRGLDGARGDAGGDGARSRRCSARRSTPARSASRRTMLNQHMGFEGRPLACRNASREELKAYANALQEARQGRDRDRADPQIGVLERGPVRAARLPARPRAAGRSPSSPCSTATTSRRRCATRCARPRR